MTETQPICRYVAAKWGPELLGKSLEDKARVDMLSNAMNDWKNATVFNCYRTDDKEEVVKASYEKLKAIYDFLGEKDYLIGDYVTYNDFWLLELTYLL